MIMNKLLYLTGILLFTVTTAYAQDCDSNEDARRYLVRAKAAFNDAKSDADFLNVVEEFKKALQYAPDCADIYYNIAACYDKSASSGLVKDIWGCGKAMEYYKKYLEQKPDAQNKQVVQNRIYELEYKYEKLNKILGLYGNIKYNGGQESSFSNPLKSMAENIIGFVVLMGNKNQIEIVVFPSNDGYNEKLDTLMAENYKTKEGVEYLKFCINFKIYQGIWDKKNKRFKKPGDYIQFGCCYYLKFINGRLGLEFEPKYYRKYENNKEIRPSIILNDPNTPGGLVETIYNKIYQAEIEKQERNSTQETPASAPAQSDDKETPKKKAKSAIGDDVYLQKDNKTTTEKAKSTTMATSVISSLIGGR